MSEIASELTGVAAERGAGAPAAAALDYAAAAGRAAPAWRHDGDAVELVIPPPPLLRRLVVPAILLAGATLLLAGPLVMFGALPGNPSGWLVVLLLSLAAGGVWLLTLRLLVRATRAGRRPAVVRVTPADLTITRPGLVDDRLSWPRPQVADVRMTATGVLPVVQEYLWVRVSVPSGGFAMVPVPWAMPHPYAGVVPALEDGLREHLGLPPVPRST